MEKEYSYQFIKEVKVFKPKRSGKEFADVVICVTTDGFYVFSEAQAASERWSQAINKKDYLYKISFADIIDIVYPAAKKLSQKIKDKEKGFPFKIMTKAEEYMVWVSEKYFWISRKMFEDFLYSKENVGSIGGSLRGLLEEVEGNAGVPGQRSEQSQTLRGAGA